MIRNRFEWMTAVVAFCCIASVAVAQPTPTGQWEFNDSSNLLRAAVGNDLDLVGAHQQVPGLTASDGAVVIWQGNYYRAFHNIPANGGGGYVNQYTLVMDIKLYQMGLWYSLYNSNESNINDGEVFIDPTGKIGVGATGYTDNPVISEDLWHRVAIVVDLVAGTITYYVDGQQVHQGTGQELDGRFSLFSVNDSTPWLLLFADNDGDDAPIFVSMAAIYGEALTSSQVAALRGPGGNDGPVAGLPIDLDLIPPQKPEISSSNPSGIEDVTLIGSAYAGSTNVHTKSVWQLSFDPSFDNDDETGKVIYKTIESETQLTRIELENSLFPFDVPVYARVRYVDEVGTASEFSNPVSITLTIPSGIKVLYREDFESTPVNQLPSGWKSVSFTEDVSDLENDYFFPQLRGWSVQEESFMETLIYYPSYEDEGPTINQIGYPIVENKFITADSGNYASQEVLYESHLLSPIFNFTGISDVVISFNSNYVQNQDNIAALEYSVDGGDMNASGTVTGTWLPIAYFLEPADIIRMENDEVDVDATLLQNPDGTQFFYEDFVFARQFVADPQELASFFHAREDDGYKDGKRFEKFRLPQADGQSQVRFRWLYMGTWSWYWGFDNLQIWGNDGTAVADWSLF